MKIIELLKYIILGIIQGLTEPLPISSSGHVFILKNLFNLNVLNDLNFEIIVNTGSLLAILILYKNDILKLIKSFFSFTISHNRDDKNDFMYAIKIIIGVIPIMIFGLLFKNYLEGRLSNIKIVGYSFLVTAILLFVSRNKVGKKNKDEITFKDSISIGLSQIIALIPGISRSGTTYISGLSRDIERKEALKYSFMMYIIISFGTIILGIRDIDIYVLKDLWIPYVIAFIFAFFTSLISLRWFINKVTTNNLKYFSLYCLIIGTLILIFM